MRFLLLDACRAGAFGRIRREGGGAALEAGFCFLEGEPNAELRALLNAEYANRMLVPLSDAWRAALDGWPEYGAATRYEMRATGALGDRARLGRMAERLPEGYALRRMTEADVAENPFGHGRAYASARDFIARGAGVAAICAGEIVSAASTFFTFEGRGEVDLSTLPAHRRRGLALAASAGLMLALADKGIEPRWDAQNAASRDIAERLGFELEAEYAAYARKECLSRLSP